MHLSLGILIGIAIAIFILKVASLTTIWALVRSFRARLAQHATFTVTASESVQEDEFEYAPPTHPALVEFREAYRLDQIAGSGTEMERIVRVMQWVHSLTKRSFRPSRPAQMTGLHLATQALEHGQRFNCWMYSTVLNDALLSLGFTSRLVHMYPPQERPKESHVVVDVYSRPHEKWVHLDADLCAYVSDEHGVPLGTGEIRQRIIDRRPLRVSDTVDISYVSFLWTALLKRIYVWYVAKNIFRIESPLRSEPGYETEFDGNQYIQLIPDGYHDAWLEQPRSSRSGAVFRYTRDERAFWRKPATS